MKKVAEPMVAQGEVTDAVLVKCEELGLNLATGLAFGIY